MKSSQQREIELATLKADYEFLLTRLNCMESNIQAKPPQWGPPAGEVDHPFKATLGGANNDEVTVHSGIMWAGDVYTGHGWCYEWTESDATAYKKTIGLTTNDTYVVYFKLKCDTATGSVMTLTLEVAEISSYIASAQASDYATQPVCYITVSGGKITVMRQELFCDFGAPIRYEAQLELYGGSSIIQTPGSGAYYVSWFTGKTYTNT